MKILLIVVLTLFSACPKATEAGTGPNSGSSVNIFLKSILRLERAVTKMELKLESLKSSLKTNKEEMMVRIDSLQTKMQSLTQIHGRLASFQVQQIQSPLTLSDIKVLKFDHVTENNGNAYNPNSGIFTAPVTGTYLFWANIMSWAGKHRYAIILQKNGQEISRGYPGYNVDHGTATISCVAMLAKGDRTWFTFHEHGSPSKLYGEKYSSYGGALL